MTNASATPLPSTKEAWRYRELRDEVRGQGFRFPDACANREETFPWTVKLLLGFGVWVGASLVALAVGLTFLDHLTGVVGLLLGLGLFLAAAGVSRFFHHPAADQLVFALSFSGQALFIVYTAELFDLDEGLVLFFAAFQIVSIVLVRSPLHRTIAVIGAGVAMLLARAFNWPLAIIDGVLLVSAWAMVWVFAGPYAVGHRQARHLTRPLGYGAAIICCGSVLTVEIGLNLGLFSRREIGLAFPLLDAVLLVSTLFALVFWAARQQGITDAGRLVTAAVVVVVVGLLTRGNLVLLVGLITVGLGHQARRRALSVLGLGVIGTGLWLTYYNLDVTLLMKSLIVIGTGAGLLVALAAVTRLQAAVSVESERYDVVSRALSWSRRARQNREAAAVGLAAFLVVVVIGGLSAEKEWHKKHGRVVLMALVPLDPRSLMQGDFMRLDTQIARDARQARRQLPQNDRRRDGWLAVTLDQNGTATFARLDPSDLGPNEVRLNYKFRQRRLKVGPTEFFFAEGRQQHFQKARFAKMAVAKSGKLLLIGLRDANRQEL